MILDLEAAEAAAYRLGSTDGASLTGSEGLGRFAGAAGADFLVLRGRMEPDVLTALCEAVNVPVYARGIELDEAWKCGASGIGELQPDGISRKWFGCKD